MSCPHSPACQRSCRDSRNCLRRAARRYCMICVCVRRFVRPAIVIIVIIIVDVAVLGYVHPASPCFTEWRRPCPRLSLRPRRGRLNSRRPRSPESLERVDRHQMGPKRSSIHSTGKKVAARASEQVRETIWLTRRKDEAALASVRTLAMRSASIRAELPGACP